MSSATMAKKRQAGAWYAISCRTLLVRVQQRVFQNRFIDELHCKQTAMQIAIDACDTSFTCVMKFRRTLLQQFLRMSRPLGAFVRIISSTFFVLPVPFDTFTFVYYSYFQIWKLVFISHIWRLIFSYGRAIKSLLFIFFKFSTQRIVSL